MEFHKKKQMTEQQLTEEEEELRIKVWQNRLGQRKFLASITILMMCVSAYVTDDVPMWVMGIAIVISLYCGFVISTKKEEYHAWKFIHGKIWDIIVFVFLIILLVCFVLGGRWDV